MIRDALLRIVCLLGLLVTAHANAALLELEKDDHIAVIGNNLADRMQHHGWLETFIHARHPDLDLTVRNLGFTGDEVKTRPRSANFGSPDQWLTKVQADVVLGFFGYNEAFRGPDGVTGFEKDLGDMIDGMLAKKYNGDSPPRIVLFSPIAHEDLNSPHLPDGSEHNKNLALYTEAMQRVCAAKNVPFVDLFNPTRALYQSAKTPLTLNGVHLLDSGNRALASVITRAIFEKPMRAKFFEIMRLREAVLEKNYCWFSRYRVVDGYNVYGGRSKLSWHGQSNADVMSREMEILDIITANRDKRVWAIAKGGDLEVKDDNIPPLLTVTTNEQGARQAQQEYMDGEAAIEKMKVADGLEVNLFADEAMFPELVNPVQMAVDTDGRLFVSVWPSYPHWNPTEPRRDRILCLPDEDRDGKADECIIFADELNSVTGLEFWGGGMLVAAPPEIWFLKDTDGDDQADLKLRMLQGVSSADTHHSANAMVMGPDGWLYWSRGIFNIANMETPTKTYRSSQSGVHRFNPRTFEVEFRFPIGPNPHGDVFDKWGYQFANDGTGGTGSYVNIGKGRGNKKWFRQRMRPVAATGILSSVHFPDRNQNNFLICNTITFLGVLQHEVHYDGADITATEIEPILESSDPYFRPTDVEVGGDGALYVSDWSNALIGHMQHNMRDPNRDHEHGRIYRVTAKGRELQAPVKLKGKPIEVVLDAFYHKTNSVRYRARLELTGRDSAAVVAAVAKWAKQLDPKNGDDAQALLECVWVLADHRMPDMDLIKKTFQADEPRVRAAAIRTLGEWGPTVDDWQETLMAAAQDDSPLVRAEAVKSAVSFEGITAAEVIFEVANRPTDAELDNVINYARGEINVDALVQDALATGRPLSIAAQKYVLRNASVADLLKMDRTEAVYRAILDRPGATAGQLETAIDGLARLDGDRSKLDLILDLVKDRDTKGQTDGLAEIAAVLTQLPAGQLQSVANQLKRFASEGDAPQTRQLGYAAWITAEGSSDGAFGLAAASDNATRDFLNAIPLIADEEVRGDLFDKVQPLLEVKDATSTGLVEPGIQVDYIEPNPRDVAVETLMKIKPTASGIVPEIKMNVPQLKRRDAFALRFTGNIQIDQPGKYRFFARSDDGSRIYVNDKLVVNNDGNHGMIEKRGTVDLDAGMHSIVVTYYDNGGGDGLTVSYAGPGIRKRTIPADKLFVGGQDTIHDVAIRSLAAIPGREIEKFNAMSTLIQQGTHQTSAVRAMMAIPNELWPQDKIRPTAESLAKYVSEIPPRQRTGKAALEAMRLTDALASLLPNEEARIFQSRLADLKVNVVRIGTVPERMIYDKERVAVQAGKPVEFIFTNTDNMPHNFVITLPGAMEEIGNLAEKTARDADAVARHFVPKSDKVLLASRLLQPNETQALSYEAPAEPGIYPYVCTYPGHWRRMYGALYVVRDVKAYSADPERYLAENELPVRDELLKFNRSNTEWTLEELAKPVSMLAMEDGPDQEGHLGREFAVGKTVFRVANCVACHKLNGEGREFGPDLAKLDAKKKIPDYILGSIIEPSKDIDEKYQNYAFDMDSGERVAGLIVEENDDVVKVAIDPILNPDPMVLKKDEIEARNKLTVSTMPKGLLSKLSREEILDLIAYVYAGGDEQHTVFASGHQHDH